MNPVPPPCATMVLVRMTSACCKQTTQRRKATTAFLLCVCFTSNLPPHKVSTQLSVFSRCPRSSTGFIASWFTFRAEGRAGQCNLGTSTGPLGQNSRLKMVSAACSMGHWCHGRFTFDHCVCKSNQGLEIRFNGGLITWLISVDRR